MPKPNKDQDFAQELKEEFSKGNLKPSQLKRSKSLGDIPAAPPNPLKKTNSQLEIPVARQPTLPEQIKQLKQDLKFANTTANNYLQNLQQVTADLTSREQELNELKKEKVRLIDQNNELRLQSLKDWYQVRTSKQELDQAAEEFVKLEDQKTNYKVQNGILLREKQDLEKQLKTAQDRIERLYQLKGLPTTSTNPKPEPTTINWTNLLWNSLLVTGIVYLLWPTNQSEQ